jgi:hypothetical protein
MNVLPIHTLPRSSPVTARIYSFSFRDNLNENEKEPQKDGLIKFIHKAASALNPSYNNVFQQYATFLTTLKRPVGMDNKKYHKFKSEALKYII